MHECNFSGLMQLSKDFIPDSWAIWKTTNEWNYSPQYLKLPEFKRDNQKPVKEFEYVGSFKHYWRVTIKVSGLIENSQDV